jgi:hypothetical protein
MSHDVNPGSGAARGPKPSPAWRFVREYPMIVGFALSLIMVVVGLVAPPLPGLLSILAGVFVAFSAAGRLVFLSVHGRRRSWRTGIAISFSLLTLGIGVALILVGRGLMLTS